MSKSKQQVYDGYPLCPSCKQNKNKWGFKTRASDNKKVCHTCSRIDGTGVWLKCPRCAHGWYYRRGKSVTVKRKVTSCARCKTSLNIKLAEVRFSTDAS